MALHGQGVSDFCPFDFCIRIVWAIITTFGAALVSQSPFCRDYVSEKTRDDADCAKSSQYTEPPHWGDVRSSNGILVQIDEVVERAGRFGGVEVRAGE